MTVFGIDVSKWQGEIDWPRVKSSGIQFAISRASIGTVGDVWFARNLLGSDAAGIPLTGAYHYLYPRSWVSPEAQCDKFLAMLGGAADGYLTVVDVEYKGTDITDVRRFAARFRDRTNGHPLIVYTGGWFWRGYMGNVRADDIGPLWESRYVDPTPGSPSVMYQRVPASWWTPGYGGWDAATLLQFTSSSVVPGIAGRCDANAFRGTLDQLRLLARPLPDTTTEDDPVITVVKREQWVPTANSTTGLSNGVLREVPERSAPVTVRVPLGTPIVTIAEVKTGPGGAKSNDDWRLVESTGTPLYALRSDWQSQGSPVPPPKDCSVEVKAATKAGRSAAFEWVVEQGLPGFRTLIDTEAAREP